MGFFDFVKGQFIKVIEWLDDTGAIVYRFPTYDNAFMMGSKLVVREGQAAIFVDEGKLADVFGPGTYTLSTQNLPVLTALKSWKYGFNSPFKTDVYYINTTNFTDLKWGTTNPIMLRDADFGMVRLRGFGTYAFRVGDPAIFLREIFGTKKEFTTDGITGFLKSIIVSGMTDMLGESRIPAVDLASSYDELGEMGATRLQPRFEAMGLALSGLVIENLSLPEEVEKMLDRRTSMNVIGNMGQYAKFQAAEAMRDAANNPAGGLAGAGAGLGAGMAMGQMMTQMMQPGMAPQQQPAQQPQTDSAPAAAVGAAGANADTVACTNCQHTLRPEQKFCPECGTARPQQRFCSQCGNSMPADAKFCSNCGNKA